MLKSEQLNKLDVRKFMDKLVKEETADGSMAKLKQQTRTTSAYSDIEIEVEERVYLDEHTIRFAETINFIPRRASNLKILDVGAGPGFLSILMKHSLQCSVEAVDLQQDVLFYEERFNKKGITIKASDFDQESLPYKDKDFDIVLLAEVMEHLKSPVRVLTEVKRVLKPGGYLILTTPNISQLGNIARLIRGQSIHPSINLNVLLGTPHAPHFREYALIELTNMLIDMGFAIDKIHMSRCWDQTWKTMGVLIKNIITLIIPRYRSCIMIRAQKSK